MAAALAPTTIAFIGLGQMGRHMAANLIKSGHHLVVCDISSQATSSLKSSYPSQVTISPTPSTSASHPNVTTVITMLPSSPHVQECYSTPHGILSSARPGTLLIDSSTIHPGVSSTLSAAAGQKGLEFLDAPVSGGVGGAEAGSLTFMVGAPSPSAFAKARPYLERMGKNIVHVGGPGAGCAAKLCNNLVLGASMLAVAEAMALGEKLGVDPLVLAGIINTSSGRCWSSDTYNPYPGIIPTAPSSRGYTGGFATALMLKDLNLALEAAAGVKATLPATSTAAALYSLSASPHTGSNAQLDFSAIIKLLK